MQLIQLLKISAGNLYITITFQIGHYDNNILQNPRGEKSIQLQESKCTNKS